MNQSRAVVVGLAALGGFLYLRAKRTPAHGSGSDPIASPNVFSPAVATGAGTLSYRGLVNPWTRTSDQGDSFGNRDSSDPGSSDAGQSIYANAGAGIGTGVGDTGASIDAGVGSDGVGSGGSGSSSGAHIGTATSGFNLGGGGGHTTPPIIVLPHGGHSH